MKSVHAILMSLELDYQPKMTFECEKFFPTVGFFIIKYLLSIYSMLGSGIG